MRHVTPDEARASIARLMVGTAVDGAPLGEVVLHAHQRDAAAMLRRQLADYRGALLADDVGLGKTFTALAVASGHRTTVLAPAGVRAMWIEAARRASVAAEIVTFEAMSRGARPSARPELVVIDEAHHLRNARTLRYEAARAICGEVPVLLLSATPLQNSEQDLRVLLSLFLGEKARALPTEQLARYIVRRTADAIGKESSFPSVADPVWLPAVDDADCLDRILTLPPAVPPRGSSDAPMLGAYSLARQWASSRAALDGAIRRRLARGLALADALRAGVHPSLSELRAWVFAGTDQQLAFPELVVGDARSARHELLAHVETHLDGLRDLLAGIRATPDPDEARIERLRELLVRHQGARIVAFSEYAETIAAFYSRLTRDTRVAMLTHTGGRVAGGPTSRAEILSRFTPGVLSPESERIDLLLTTDVLSEGVGLHAASVIVHLDLAWNPARLAQRVGRLRRIGATSQRVFVYLMPPPAPTERLLRIGDRLRAKLDAAGVSLGKVVSALPGTVPRTGPAVERDRAMLAAIAAWRREITLTTEAPMVSAVCGDESAALACVRDGERVRLLAWVGGAVTEDPAAIRRVVALANGAEAEVRDEMVRKASRLLAAWLDDHALGAVVDLTALRVARSRRTVLHRVDGISRRAPRHTRSRVAALVRAARVAATTTLSAGAERVLDELARAPMPDDAWLHAVSQFAELHARPAGERRIEVLLLVTP